MVTSMLTRGRAVACIIGGVIGVVAVSAATSAIVVTVMENAQEAQREERIGEYLDTYLEFYREMMDETGKDADGVLFLDDSKDSESVGADDGDTAYAPEPYNHSQQPRFEDMSGGSEPESGASAEDSPHPVPDVVGLSQNVATMRLVENGFNVSVNYEYSGDVQKGHVIRYSPNGSDNRPVGTTVTIIVSSGEEPDIDYLLEQEPHEVGSSGKG